MSDPRYSVQTCWSCLHCDHEEYGLIGECSKHKEKEGDLVGLFISPQDAEICADHVEEI